MVSEHQHQLNIARNEGYVHGHRDMTRHHVQRVAEIEGRHRNVVAAKNEVLISITALVATKTVQISERDVTINEQGVTISALQQSLDEATARIDALTPKPKPEPKFKVGDKVKTPTSMVYTIRSIQPNGRLNFVGYEERVHGRGYNPDVYTLVEEPEPTFKVGDMVRREAGFQSFEVVSISATGMMEIRSHVTNVVYRNRNVADFEKVS